MFVEKIKSEGLAHLSYLLGDGEEAAVVDPRRDWEVYVEMARERGCRIAHIFETHRNEDLVSGAAGLSQAIGAPVHHGPNPEDTVRYADTVREAKTFSIGKLTVRVLETPGHTDDSLSFVLSDGNFGEEAVAVFTGDALFVGDVGRTDFYPDRAEEVAGLLYDSLQKLLALGDQAILYPAHGAGSVCGDAMADREFSTLGYERTNNPRLQIGDREAFVAAKLAEHHELPPYFRRMEELNLEGALARTSDLLPLQPADPGVLDDSHLALVDVRGVSAYQGAHLPGSLSLPEDMISTFAGWLLDPDREIVLVADDAEQAERAMRHLFRIGFDRIAGFLPAALPRRAATGRSFHSLPVVDTGTVARRVSEQSADWSLLDVRGRPEAAEGMVEGARHAFLGRLPGELESLEPSRHYTLMCGSGVRATIAASLLRRAGFEHVDVFLGSMAAWKGAGHPTVKPAS